jgi:DnaK suppressor protein
MLAQTIKVQQQDRLLQEMNQVRADLLLIDSRCTAGLDRVGGDIADQASYTVELATSQALYHLHQQKLAQLERAWARVLTGQYGLCELCSAQIEPARLNAIPHATLCVRCQQRTAR